MAELSIKTSNEACTPKEVSAALASLTDHSVRSNGALKEDTPFSVLAFMDEKLVGGLIGNVFWNWLYADLVWVDEDFRSQGVGTQVMKAAEIRALEMKLTGIYLWTESWQAPGFYKKLGYAQFVELKDFPPSHSRFGFCKYLR